MVLAVVVCALVAPWMWSVALLLVFLDLVPVVVFLAAIGTGGHTGACGGTSRVHGMGLLIIRYSGNQSWAALAVPPAHHRSSSAAEHTTQWSHQLWLSA